jgi:hypothetical protein
MRNRRLSFPPAVAFRLVVIALACLALARPARGDAFDHYTNPVLGKAIDAGAFQEVKQVTAAQLLEHDRVLPGLTSAFLVVKTNQSRNAKLLVRAARQKIDDERSVPILLVERYVTYKEGEEQTVLAAGRGVSLFPGFRLSLDMGQVVPDSLGGDLRFVGEGKQTSLQPVGKAKLYLVTKALPNVEPKKGPKLVVGPKFEPKYFNGTYKLYDDGRRSGRLVLKVDDDGSVSGAYYSDRDGQKYELRGHVGTPQHSIQFTVKLPRVEQTFQGWLFTGDAKALTGSSRMADREAGFYAVRVED